MTNTQSKPPANVRPVADALASAAPPAPLGPPRLAKLEKIAVGAARMAISVVQVYREAKAGRLTIIKLGPRASALSSAEVDAWIAERIAAAQSRSAGAKGGNQ